MIVILQHLSCLDWLDHNLKVTFDSQQTQTLRPSVCVCGVHVRRPEVFHFTFLKRVLSLNLEINDATGQPGPGILSAYTHTHARTNAYYAFMWVLGILTQALMLL